MALKLILQVTDGQKLEVGDPQRIVFGAAGGRIGRSLECDWVLSSRYVSRHHATVSCAGGVFHIESLGDNGVALNDSQQRLPKRERCALNNGDRLFIDEYEILVTVLDTNAAREAKPAALARLPALVVPLPVRESGTAASSPASLLAFSFDAMDSGPGAKSIETPDATTLQPHEDTAALLELFALREPALPDLAPTEESAVVSAPPAPEIKANGAERAGFDVAAFFSGAGVEPAALSADTAYGLGQIVRVSVQAVIGLLRARTQFRNDFRLPITGVGAPHHNFLKSAVDAEEALDVLLRPRSHDYPLPLQSFVEACEDIRCHQMALAAGLRAGFDGVLRQFDPKTLLEQFARSGRGGVVRLGSKAHYWEQYVDMFDNVASYPDTAFQRLVRDEFSDAYQRCLDELKRNPDFAPQPQAPLVQGPGVNRSQGV